MSDSPSSTVRTFSETPATDLSLRIRLGWGMGTVAMSLMFQSTSLLVLKYLVDNVGVAAGLAGLLIGAAKAYDAVTDPLMGTISDRTKSRWGRRRPYLLLGAAVSAASFVLLFNLGTFSGLGGQVLAALVAFALLLNATGYTIFNVPYLAMPVEMTSNYHERTKLISFRAGAVSVGGILATAVGPFIISKFGGGVPGHTAMSYALGLAIFAAGLACLWMTRDAPTVRHTPQQSAGLKQQFLTALENRPFVLLLGVKVMHLIGLATYLSSMPFFFSVILGVPLSWMGFYFLVQSSFILASQFGWVRFTKRLGKNRAYYLAAFFYVSALASWLLASGGEALALILLRAVFTGIGAGGVLLIGQSLLPDTMQYDYQRTGLRREGVFAGVYTTAEKLSFALGPALMGIMLGAAGYVGGLGALAEQTRESHWVIYAGVSVLPAIGIASAALIMTRFRLAESDLNREEARATG